MERLLNKTVLLKVLTKLIVLCYTLIRLMQGNQKNNKGEMQDAKIIGGFNWV